MSDESLLREVERATGLVCLKGPVSWAQQQLIEKLADPTAQKIAKILRTLETGKRSWDKVLEKLAEAK